MTSVSRFDVHAELTSWSIRMIKKHLPLDEQDEREFNGIVRDAKFYETVLHLQLEGMEEDSESPSKRAE
jgi:hypothetical protein